MSTAIYELLPKVMADIGAVGRDRTNQQQRYKFRGIDDALNAVHPALVKHGVSMSIEVTEHELEKDITVPPDSSGFENPKQCMVRATLRLRLSFYGPDGSSVSNVAAGEALDYNGDKATNKAMSAATKYALFLGLCIPVEETALDDSDRDGREPEQQYQRPTNGHANGSGNGGQQQHRPPQTNGQAQGRAPAQSPASQAAPQSGEKNPQEATAERFIDEAMTPERIAEMRDKIKDPARKLPADAISRLEQRCNRRLHEIQLAAKSAAAPMYPPGY